MATLTGCMKKAGKILRAEDRKAIESRFNALVKDGRTLTEAARAAVDEQIATVRAIVERAAQGAGVVQGAPNEQAQQRPETVAGKAADGGKAKLSRIDGARESRALRELAQNDELFALPRLNGKTVSEIAFDLDPEIKVTKRTAEPGRQTWRVELPEGGHGDITIRKPNPHGPSLYGFDLQEGEMANVVTERPGENAQAVPDDTEDVWIDVSQLKTGQGGNKVYAIAGALAHNTGRIFIGDPNGLSTIALRRRSENMLSLAMRYGTTEFLAPHPDQIRGSKTEGVPPLKWVYGDHEGNAERLVALNLKAMENAVPSLSDWDFDANTGEYIKADERRNRESFLGDVAGAQRSGESPRSGDLQRAAAAGRTAARAVVLRALSRQEGGTAEGRGAGRDGVLARLGAAASGSARTGLKALFSRTADGGGRGIDFDSAQALVTKLAAGGLNRINVARSVADLPAQPKRWIADKAPDGRVRGAYLHGTDQVWLFTDNITGADEFVQVALHEHFHRGLARTIPEAGPLLMQMHRSNKALQAATKERIDRFDIDMLEAIEEALADMAAEGRARYLTGWDKLLQLIRDWIGKAASAAGLKMEWTDDMVADFVAGMTREGLRAPVHVDRVADESALSRSSDDIRLSRSFSYVMNDVRDFDLPAKYKVGDLFDSAGKVHWWHKTVGTMHNLAAREPLFKRVYDAVQSFIGDVSFYATKASDLAPRILPKLEHWRDIGKTPLSAEDTKAISAPIFEGTLKWARTASGELITAEEAEKRAGAMSTDEKARELLRTNRLDARVLKMWQGMPIEQFEAAIQTKYENELLQPGVVFTDRELRSMFNMSTEQVELYREFRKAVDKSLNDLAVSDILRYGGEDVAQLREWALNSGDVMQVGQRLRDHVWKLADTQTDRKDVLNDTGRKIMEKAERARDLMQRGYAPLSRFGQYSLDVVDADGQRVYFGLFEGTTERAKMARQMRAQFPGATIETGTVSQEAHRLFAGVSPETLELFGEMIGLEASGNDEASKAFQQYIKLTKSTRSAMRRLIERKGIAGFSEDAGRVLAGFVYSNARQTASNLHMGEITKSVADIPKGNGQLQDAAVQLAEYVKNPQEEAQAIRGLLFAQYLGGSVASALVNMTQPATVTFPYLSQWGGAAKAAKRMVAAARTASKDQTGDAALDQALQRAEELGIVAPQEVHQLQAQAMGRATLRSGDGTTAGDLAAKGLNSLSILGFAWGKLFGMAEQVNRRVTFIAAYRTAVDEGIADPEEFAKRAVVETQFTYNKGSKPRWARGAVGSVLFTFKQYSISYMELMNRTWNAGEAGSPERAAGRKAVLLMLGVLLLAGGADGLPFMQDAEDVIDGVLQRLGYNFSTKQARREFLVRTLGEDGAYFVSKGVSGMPGVPIDLSGRMGMGNLVPGTGLFVKKPDNTRDLAEIAGPIGDFAKRAFNSAGQLVDGDVAKAAETISPVAVRNVTKAYDMANTGMYRDDRGRKVLDVDGFEAMAKALGFQPADVAKVQEATFTVQRMVSQSKMRESEIAEKWAIGIFEGDQAKVAEARAEMARWNENNPAGRIRIDMPQVLKRVRAMRQSKAERIAKTAPREMRAQVRAELADLDQ